MNNRLIKNVEWIEYLVLAFVALSSFFFHILWVKGFILISLILFNKKVEKGLFYKTSMFLLILITLADVVRINTQGLLSVNLSEFYYFIAITIFICVDNSSKRTELRSFLYLLVLLNLAGQDSYLSMSSFTTFVGSCVLFTHFLWSREREVMVYHLALPLAFPFYIAIGKFEIGISIILGVCLFETLTIYRISRSWITPLRSYITPIIYTLTLITIWKLVGVGIIIKFILILATLFMLRLESLEKRENIYLSDAIIVIISTVGLAVNVGINA